MELLRAELAKAKIRLGEAKDARAKAALEGVILGLEWAFEDGGRASPSSIAEQFRSDPLDQDNDGHKGGSKKGKLATAKKAK